MLLLTATQAMNPGNLSTDLDRTSSWPHVLARKVINYPPVYGAYTELFAALSPDVALDNSVTWSELTPEPSLPLNKPTTRRPWTRGKVNKRQVVPWGRSLPIRNDLALGSKPESEGGTGIAEQFWAWCEKEVSSYQ